MRPKKTTSEPAMNGPIAAKMRAMLKQKPTPVARRRVGNSSGKYGVKVPRMPLVKKPISGSSMNSVW